MATSAVQQKKLARDAKMAAYNSTKTSAIEAGKMDTFILPETTQAINATAPTTTTQPKSTLTSQYENKAGYKNKPEGSGWTYNSLTDTWTGGVAPQTEEQQATALADVPYMEASQLGDTMFGENNPLAGKTGFTGAVVDEYEKRAAEDKKYQEEQNAKAKALEESDLKKLTGAGLDSIDAVTAAYGQGREGVQSAGRPETIRKYQDSIRTDITNAQTRFDYAQAVRDKAQVELDRAIQDGRAEIIEMRQTNLAQAEQQLRTEKLAVLDAEARAVDLSLSLNEDQRAREQQNAANLESFTSLVGQGVTLPTESIIGFANQLNVPFQAAFDYYQGAEAIRADKSLSVEEKQIANQENYFKLQDTISGGALAVQKKVDYFTQLASSGLYSNDQLGALASAMDLNNSSNPVFQAEQRMNAADVKIKEYEAANLGNPPPVGSVERLDYDIKVLEKQKAQLEMQELYGTTGGAYVPSGEPKEGIQVTFNNGQFNVTSPPDKKFSCAAGVNRTYGTSFGDQYSQKAGIVQGAIDNGTGVSGEEAASNPYAVKPGMIFVMPTSGNTAQWGHVGIVKSVNPENGTFTTYEWNADGAMRVGGVQEGTNNQTTEVRNINQMFGFMEPPKSKLEGANEGAGKTGVYSKFYNQAIESGFSDKEAAEIAKKQYEKAYEPPTDAQSKSIKAIAIMQEEADLYEGLFEAVDKEKFADELDFIARRTKEDDLLGDVLNKYTLDPEVQQAIYSEMRWLEATLREESGASITMGEYKSKGRQYFPRPGDSEKALEDKAKARATALESKYMSLGPKAEVIFAKTPAAGAEAPVFDRNSIGKEIEENEMLGIDDDFYSEIDFLFDN
jgi:hypothetical protein